MTTDTEVAPTPSAVPDNVAGVSAVAGQIIEAVASGPATPPLPKGKIFATWLDLEQKKARTDDVLIRMKDSGGEWVERYIRIQALGANDYDDLVAKHKPTAKQQNEGQVFNIDTFLPALISACAVQPTLTEEQVKQLNTSPNWAGGEIGGLFQRCQRICMGTPDLAFIEAD